MPGHKQIRSKKHRKGLVCLKELQARNYITYHDGNCISCETKIPIQKISEEYAAAKSLMKVHFG